MDLFIHSQRFFHPRFHTARSSLQQTDQRRGNAARAGESSVGMCTGNARGRTVSAGVATAGRGLTVTAEVVALMVVLCRLCCHSSGGVRALQCPGCNLPISQFRPKLSSLIHARTHARTTARSAWEPDTSRPDQEAGDEHLRRGVAGSEDVRQCQRGDFCRCALAAVRELLPGACGTWQNMPLSLLSTVMTLR